MRKIITIAMLLFSMASYAQGNLQFNQILNLKNGDNYTVPSNKILKIVSINFIDTRILQPLVGCRSNGISTIFCDYADVIYFKIDNVLSYYNGTGGVQKNAPCTNCDSLRSYSVNPSTPQMPIWLNSGKNINIIGGSGIFISAIEFNIVP